MAARQTIAIAVLADAAGVRKGTAEGQQAIQGFGTSAMGILKKVGGAYLAFKGAEFMKNSITGAIAKVREQDQLLAKSEAVIKSTGGAANVTAGQVAKMAAAMEAKSMTDEEVIQNGANVLLTFTKIRNEAGKGNDIFNQGTQAALDMSTALGTDMQSASQLVGKALNDPIKGISALSRSGVQFTEDQKGMIRSLVESGDVMGAQKVILGELNTQFGGQAAAAAKADGGVKRLKDMWASFGAEVVRKVMPAFLAFTAYLVDNLPGALASVSNAAATLTPTFTAIASAVTPVFQFMAENVGVVGTFVGVIAGIAAVTKVWAIAQGILNAVMLLNPIGLVVVAIAALAAGLVYAYKRSETFRTIVQAAFTVVRAQVSILKTVWTAVFKALGAIVGVIARVVRGYINMYVTAFKLVISAAQAMYTGARDWFSRLGDKVRGIGSTLRGYVSNAGEWLKNAGRAIINGLISGVTERLGALYSKVSSIGGMIKRLKGPIEYDRVMLRPEGQAIMDGLINAIESKRASLARKMRDVTSDLAGTRLTLGDPAFAGPAPVGARRAGGDVIHVYITLDPSKTDAQQGVDVWRKIEAAKREGLVITR